MAGLLDADVIRRFARLDLRARYIVDGYFSGMHRSIRRGRSTEFSDRRAFVPGDDPRDVDARAYARTGRLFIREYRAETNLRLYLVVDVSASMHYGSRPEGRGFTKFAYASCVAGALGYLALRQGDRVGLTLVDDRLRLHMPPKNRRSHYHGILEALANARPGPRTNFPLVMGRCADLARRRGVVVVFSDFLADAGEAAEGLARLRYRGAEVIAFRVIDPAERDFPFSGPHILVDPETGTRYRTSGGPAAGVYRDAFKKHGNRLARAAREAGVDYQELFTDTPFDAALGAFLTRRAGQR